MILGGSITVGPRYNCKSAGLHWRKNYSSSRLRPTRREHPMNDPQSIRVRFGTFELDTRSGELFSTDPEHGRRKVLLPEQAFRILRMLIELAGGVASREDIRSKLWPDDTAVDFDHSINVAIRTLRRALGDSASKPKYIETLARRGYRLMVPVEKITDGGIKDNSYASNQHQEMEGLPNKKPAPKRHMWKWTFAAVLALIAVAGMLTYGRHQGAMRLSANDAFFLACPIFCFSCIVGIKRRTG